MRIFTIKTTGQSDEVLTLDKEEVYTAHARDYSSIELSNRMHSRRRMRGSVAAYTPIGGHLRIWGHSLVNNTIVNLWRGYTKLFASVGMHPTYKAQRAFFNILKKYNNSSKEERWVVFFEE